MRRRPRRSPCSPWSPVRTWNPPRVGRHRRAVADRPEGRPGPDDLHRRPGDPARPQDQSRTGRTDSRPTSGRSSPTPGLITDRGADQSQRPREQRRQPSVPACSADGPTIPAPASRCWRDSAYGSGEMLAALARAGHTAVIKPMAVAPRGRGRVHPGRLHRRRGRRHRDLPERDHPADRRQTDGHVRRRLRRLPAAGPVHHRHAAASSTCTNTTHCCASPPATRHGPGLPGRSTARHRPMVERVHRLAHPRQPPRSRYRGVEQEQRLAAPADRGAEPAHGSSPSD